MKGELSNLNTEFGFLIIEFVLILVVDVFHVVVKLVSLALMRIVALNLGEVVVREQSGPEMLKSRIVGIDDAPTTALEICLLRPVGDLGWCVLLRGILEEACKTRQ